jgi:hypothetical protein
VAREQDTGHARGFGGGDVTGGWLRRNWWGLLLLAPVVALALALPVHDVYREFWDTAPRTPVTAGASGWVGFDGSDMRLTALAPDTDFTDDLGAPIKVPPAMTIWRASITFRGAHPSALLDCDLRLVDTSGTTYEVNPQELTDIGVDFDFASCAPDSTEKPPPSWTTVAYFVAPKNAHPTGVRVVIPTELPRYAELTLH